MNVLWGSMSPQKLQQAMELFQKDLECMKNNTLDMVGIASLASLGASGSQPSHCWRDLRTWLPKPKLPPLHWMFLPMHHNILGRFSKSVPMILPHKLFPAIFHHYPVMFDKLVYGSVDHCRKFWQSVRGSEQFRSYP